MDQYLGILFVGSINNAFKLDANDYQSLDKKLYWYIVNTKTGNSKSFDKEPFTLFYFRLEFCF